MPVYMYVDEAQNFKTPALPVIFSEARKYGLSLLLGNQYFDQLQPATRQAIKGNVGTRIMFEAGTDDVRDLQRIFNDGFTQEDLLNLGRFNIAVKTQVNNETQPALKVRTNPPQKNNPNGDATERRIRAMSKKLYTPRSREEVAAWYKQRYRRGKKKYSQQLATDDDFEPPEL